MDFFLSAGNVWKRKKMLFRQILIIFKQILCKMLVGQIRIILPQLKNRYRFFFSRLMVGTVFYTINTRIKQTKKDEKKTPVDRS